MIPNILFRKVDMGNIGQWSLKETLTEEGYKTDTIASAEKALSRITKIPDRTVTQRSERNFHHRKTISTRYNQGYRQRILNLKGNNERNISMKNNLV